MLRGTLYRLAAFTDNPAGGNPAGVWIGEALPSPEEMQRIAAEVGYSETAFITPLLGQNRVVRYYSPEMEVPFCGHATIASGVVLGSTEGDQEYHLSTAAGDITVKVYLKDGIREASLVSVEPRISPASDILLRNAVSALNWEMEDLDYSIPPIKAYAGAWHLVITVKNPERLNRLNYNFESLKKIMLREELTTLQLLWRENENTFHSRNPFPVGGVVEDPATGAAAAALGGYLREAELIKTPALINIIQGVAMGRPSKIKVEIPQKGGIIVIGRAVYIDK